MIKCVIWAVKRMFSSLGCVLAFFEGVRRPRRAQGAGARRAGGQFGMQLLKRPHRTAGSGLGLAHCHLVVWL